MLKRIIFYASFDVFLISLPQQVQNEPKSENVCGKVIYGVMLPKSCQVNAICELDDRTKYMRELIVMHIMPLCTRDRHFIHAGVVKGLNLFEIRN
jgi:hypothetical protein